MLREPTAEKWAFLSTLAASRRERRLALAVLLVSLAMFLVAAPFAKLPLAKVPAFIPIYESALVINDLITAILLFGQFNILRSKALWVLACGYLFTAFTTVAHALTFPGLFSATGWLAAGSQSTAWLYMFWHGGFPLFIVAYSLLSRKGGLVARLRETGVAVAAGVLLAASLATVCTLIAIAGHDALPAVIVDNRYTPSMIVVVSTVWSLSALALVALLWRRRQSLLDLWLIVVMTAWLFDIALSAVLNAGRFDLGFYAGRIYGLMAASFVLIVLLLENGMLYARLVSSHLREQQRASDAQRLSSELATANRLLGEKNHELEEASRLKSEFLSNMSHELRTPLNAVIGFSEVMKDGLAGQLTTQQHGYVGHIFQSGHHLLALINDILDLSKIEAGKVEIEFESVDLDALLNDTVSLLVEKAKAGKVRLERDARATVGSFMVDRRRLKQILFNLVSNAIKFTPAGGHVSLRDHIVTRAHAASALPGYGQGFRTPLAPGDVEQFVEISVVDTGIGISAADAARLFTPFTQIANAQTRRMEGTGLGLAMVKRLADLQGGCVAVTSEPGEGSWFTVWLPWRETASKAASAVVNAPASQPAGSRYALVVEDDDEAAELMRLQLAAEGFEVRRVATAEAALALVGERTPDLITVDILLPGMDGWEFIARVKQVPAWEQVPVVVVSVAPDPAHGFSLGAPVMLQKPVKRDALAKGLSRLNLTSDRKRGVTALVVDDDPIAVELMASHLHQSGCIVLRAMGGREGIALARRFEPDLIALDLEMPDLNGFEVVNALSKHPATANIPIIIVTAQQLTRPMRDRLSGHIRDIVDKSDFEGGRFIGEVRRAVGSRMEHAY